MNDIQAKENIFNSANASVEKQKSALSESTSQLAAAQSAYLNGVVRAATLSEKTRRKKDTLCNLIVWGSCAFIALIMLLINPLFGVLFIVGVGIIAFVVKNQTEDAKTVNYNNRKDFFRKYSHAVPTGEKLKWKDGAISYSGSVSTNPIVMNTTTGWTCPQCSTKNTNGSNFCSSCGTKKP